jgi:uncharacterized membrane protein
MQNATTLSLGRSFFGAATMASGVLQLATGEFVRLVPKPPAWVPAQAALAYLVGVVLVVLGLAILSGRMVRTATTVLAAMLLFDLVFIYPPSMFANPLIDRPLLRGFMYTNPLKCLALIGGAAILAGRFPDRMPGPSRLDRGVGKWERYGALLLAVFLIVCGFQHFWYRVFVDTLVPTWIPPNQRFWTLFAGVALMAGGVGILVPATARLSASLSGLMIFLWVLMLHIPRAIVGPAHAFETAGVFEALALSGVALVVAATRGEPGPEPQALRTS